MSGNKFNILKNIHPNPPLVKGGSSVVLNQKYGSNAQSGYSPLLAGEMSTDRGVKGIKKFHFPQIMSNKHTF